MIVLPDEILLKRIDSELKRGKILRTELILHTGSCFKRLILLNKDFSEDNLFFIFSTTNVGWFKNYSQFTGVKGNFIIIPKGMTKDNPNEDIVIDCRRVHSLKKEKLLENHKNNKLHFLGEIPTGIMGAIDNIISISKLISPKIKKHII